MKRSIYVVTHGDKENCPNPGLIEKGVEQIKKIMLPIEPMETIICGTGKRHIETMAVLQVRPNRYNNLVGSPDSGEQNADGEWEVILADGTRVPANQSDEFLNLKMFLPVFFKELEHNTLLISGRPLMMALGFKKAGSGQLFHLEIDDQGKISLIY